MFNNAQLNASLQQALGSEYRSPESFAYTRTIQAAWGGLDPVVTWCKSELVDDWRWQVKEMSSDHRPGTYNFYFDSSRDCAAFSLKWC
jgi:hypothetical protein